MRMVEELDELTFWAFNTKYIEKFMKEHENEFTFGMSESEKRGYSLGVENAFSITNQLLKQAVDNESIQFYNPDLDSPENLAEEFSKEDLLEWLSKQKDC